jgi:hypothetical protein
MATNLDDNSRNTLMDYRLCCLVSFIQMTHQKSD